MALTRPRYSQIPDTDWKQSVRVATTEDVGNVMLAAMPNTVDGITLNFYDRVLLKSQANAAQNGIYYVKAVGTGANGIWERTKDASSGGALGAVTPSIVTQVEEGTINKNRTFKLTTTGNIDLGTTDLSFGVQAAEPAGSTGQLQFANVNNVIGGATTTSYDYTTGNLVLTGNVNTSLLYQNGKRVPQVFTSVTPPATPAVGDQWYQVGTDIVYEWLQDGATAYWIDISGATIANINPITGQNIGTLVVNSGDESTSTTTGALQVVGGVGITGNLNVGGSVSFGGGQLGSDLVISSNTTSISETTGAIRIASPGGLGVGGNIWAGGAIVANSRIPSTSITTGAIVLPGTGGLGIGGNVWVGQDVNVIGNITGGGVRQTISSTAPVNPTVGDQWYQLGTDILYQYVSDGTGKYWVDIAGATVANISAQSQQSLTDIQIVSGTPSTSASTGALTVSGGVGIQGNLNLAGGFNVSGGNIVANQNVTSIDTTTGSMVVTGQGGLGIGGNINVGGNLSVAQSANFLQNVTISANLVASGTYFSAGGLSVTNGNIVTTGTSAQIGGLTISNGAISGLTSLGITGAATIGADLTVTGNIVGGGVRKTSSITAPVNPVVGDTWYKTDTDVYYTYVNDGTNKYWIDYTSATVSNTNPLTASLLNDLSIQSGTPATSTTSGALQVAGGVGVTGNVFTGNLSTSTVSASAFTYANGVSILAGNEGTYSNANVTAYLTARTTTISDGFLSTAGMTVTAGNLKTTSANVGGLIIENGGLSSLASLAVIGAGTVGGDFAVTGNITGGGLRKYAQINAPANPVTGDVWYKTDTDVYYTYVNDGTNKYWIDYTSASVSNANPTSPQSLSDLQIVSGTPSTSTTSGALQVTGGVGVTGNINAGNISVTNVSAGLFTYANGVSILAGNEGTYSNANVVAYLAASNVSVGGSISASGNLTASGSYFSAGGLSVTAGNIVASGASAVIGGLTIENGGISSLASLNVIGSGTLGGDFAITGNITAGGLRKYTQINAPANPVVGDVWYKTDTDVFYQYVNDGTNKYWIDYTSATVSNANPTSPQSLQDLQIVSGTPSTGSGTGALQVTGGAAVTGNLFSGNLTTTTVAASNFTYANGVSILLGNEGTYSNANVTAYLTARNVTIADGNITATGGYLSAGGFVATAGNIRTTSANIGGVIIESGGIGQLASLGVVGAATIGGDVAITGNITAGGLRKYAQVGAPANPVVGDVWYKTDTDVYYQYINDGTSKYWVDYSSATVSNASPTTSQSLQDLQIVSGTASTSTSTGALVVQGGIGASGNVFTGNLSTGTVAATNFTYANGVSILAGNEGTYSNANVTAYLTARTTTISDGFLSTAGMTVTAGNLKTTSANIGGVVIESGGIGSLASLAVIGAGTVGGDFAITGNITAGGLRKYAQINAPVNPVVGDVWYKTDTDVFYQYVNDGTSKYWIDYTSATVSNANPTSPQSLQDLQIVSGTPSTSTTSGALQVTGGVGISGNINAGNVTTGTLTATTVNSSGVVVGTGFTYANGVSILVGNEGTYSNSNVTAYLTARTTTVSDGFLSTAGMTVTAGNLKTASANIGGLIIENGGFGSLASLGVVGAATIGADLAVTGNITGGGLRKYAQTSAPANPVVGDVWYKTDTDVYYTYINDGTNKYWVDYIGATVSNASITSSQIAYDIVVTTDTQSTSATTGAIRVQGGIGLIGNIFTTGIANFGGNLTAGNILSNNNLQTTTLQVTSDANVTGNLAVNRVTASGNITSAGQYFSAAGLSVTNGNITATGTTATIAGLTINNGAFADLTSLGVIGLATFGANVNVTENVNVTKDITASGNIMGGGLRKYAQIGAPANPVVGDVWYKTDTDVYYQYINDGTNKYWIDYSSATVSNASPTSLQSIQDLAVVGGTPSTSTSTGAITILGGVGLSGNINVGGNASIAGNASVANLASSGVVSGTGFTYANGQSILVGNEGTYSNANVTAYLTARTTTISDGFLSTAGMTVTAGNLKTTSANIGGVVIESGGIGSLASLNVIGGATIGGDVAVTGNITGGGIRKTTSISAPATPTVGDQWYKQDTDTLYQYINDGTTKYWVDVAGATVSNARTSGDQIAYDIVVTTDTQSTSPTTGAVRVQGGIGLIGNIYTTGIADFGGNLRAGNITANNNLQTTTLQVTSDAAITGNVSVNTITAVGNITGGGTYFSAGGISVTNGNVVATGTTATIGGLVINNGGLPSLPTIGVIGAATFGANVDVTGNVNITRDIIASGNIVAGGVRKYAQTAKPTNAVPGDVWYKTDTDVYYTYVNDGTSSYWIDYVGATVSNAAVDNSTNQDFTIASGTLSTDPTTGALVVVGGVGVTGDINTTGDFTIDGTFTACTAVTAGYLNVADGIDSYGNVIIHGPGTTNYTVQVRSSDAADDVLGIKTSVAGGGFAIDALNSELIGSTPMGINANTFSIGIKNSVGTTVQADAFKLDTAGNASVAKTLSIGQHVNVTGNISASNANFTKVVATTANFATLNLSGTLTVPTLNVTTSIDAPGIRKYAQISAPASPSAGDVWYKTDTDVYYTYVNDGTGAYWIDYVGATVSNAAVSAGTGNDFRITSGTASANTDTGALTVVGGFGITGDINTGGNVSVQAQLRAISGVQSTSTTTGALVVTGGAGISGNVNIGAALAVDSFQVAGVTNLSGNLSGTNMSLTGRADIAGNLDVVGRITGGGIRKTSSISTPVNPVVGDVWYKTDTDVYYQYINDGANNIWVDYAGATVSNAAVTAGAATDYAFTSGTPSTSTGTGAVVVSGGVGISGALYIGGLGDFGGNVTVNNLNSNLNVQTGTLAVSGSGAVVGNLTTGNLATGIATIARADIAGALVVGGDVTVTGNIVGGGVRKTQSTTAPVNPSVGDLWYKTDTDVYYQYTSDGTNKYWIDYVGATVSNAAVQNSSSVDFTITSGTESTSTTTGALTIIGGAGITGNINADNVIATSFRSDNFLFANGRTLADRITGTYSNSNVTAYLTGSITTGAINAIGNITAGNISTTDITSRDITARDVTLSGNITGGGLRKYAQAGVPANPVLGDVWYKTDTDVYYQYINDGANNFWVDYAGATVSNAAVQNGTNSDFAIASGTLGTSPTTGALVVTGGVGVTGNIYTTGIADFGGNLRADNVYANNNTQTNTLAVVQNATVGGTLNVTGAVSTGNLTTGNIVGYGFTTNAGNLIATGAYLSAGGISATSGVLSVGNIISSGTRAVVGGLTIENGAFGSVASLAVIAGATFGGDVAITGNITAGGLRKYAQAGVPANPVVGDVWYKTDTDVFYQYVDDGTSKYWIDYTSATVSNANPTSPQSLQDLQIVSGTPSTSTTSGALQVTGGAGISGNVTAGNVVTAQVSADTFTYANGVSILVGNEGTYSNANVTAYLTARTTTISDGFLSTAGMTVTAGNLKTTSANIGGLIIENNGISSLASLGVIGSATVGADLAVTGNITGGGLRKYAQDTAPVNPVVGDVWYKTDSDVYYQYINDGTNKFWVDYVGATVSNASITSSQIAYDIVVTTDTQSTSTTTGAIRVQGGIGLIGNIYTTGIADFGGNLRAGNVYANNNTQTNTLAVINNATIGGTLDVTGSLSAATLSAGNSTVGNIAGYGFTTNAGNLTASGAYFSAGGMSSINGNITVGNINAYRFIVSNGNITSTGTYARVGGLEIINGGFGSLASLGVVGSATIGADLAVTGNITGGGLRKTQSTTPPANPVQGDVWYKTDTDVYYQYINDGNASYWIDYVSATVANVTQNAATVSDLQIVSGTPSTSTSTGALTVAGGVGITSDVNIGGNASIGANTAISGNVVISSGTRATQHNTGALVITGNGGASIGGNLYIQGAIEIDRFFVSQSYAEFGEFVGVNGNIIGRGDKITGGGFQAEYGNVTASGQYFSAGGLTSLSGNLTGTGFSITGGNVITTGQKAVVGGLTIENGSFGGVASLNVIGAAIIGADLAVTGNVTGGGIRKTTSINAPANPVVGDLWYKTDTDVLYQYLNDGTNQVWIDFASATVANITAANAQYGTDVGFVSGTLSTNQTNGAVTVIGGVGVTGNINLTGRVTALDTITGQSIVSNTGITAQTLSLSGNATLGNITGYGFATNNGNVTATGDISGYGFATNNGNLSASGAYFSAGGMSSTNGNITVGNINAYSFIVSNGNITATGTYAQIGGLVIQNGGFGSLASLGVTGAATFGANVDITGRVTGGGIRKTTSINAPANPTVGDTWYKTDTDILYQYIHDGTSNYWVDMASASVANVTVTAETVNDLEIVSGTPSIDPTTGALRVAGGVGIIGDVNISSNVTVGNVVAGTVYTPTVRASSFTYPNSASILDGYYFGTYSNANVGGYLTAQGIGTTGGNLTASGAYFSAGGLTSLNGAITGTGFNITGGNIITTGTKAVVGGLTIENGAFGSVASLGVIGSATIGGDVAITGNIVAGGVRKYAQANTPANPISGDVWYKTDADIFYTYVNDGTSTYWIDYTSAAIANITVANAQYGTDVGFVSGTLSTNQTTGAVVVIGGIGVTGNINLTGQITAAQQVQVQSLVSNTSIAGATLSIAGDTSVGNLTAGNITAYGFTTNNGNVVATGKLTVGGLSIIPGNLSATGTYFSAGGLTSLNGNLTATGTTATIGGLVIANGGFGSLASLDVIGSTVIGGNLTVTGNIVGGGVRKTTSLTAPANPTIGDQWYKTDTDILYQFMDDGTSTYWVDFASATVANITNDFDGLGDFQTIGNVIGNGIVSDNYYYANGVSFVTTTVANTQNIVANITNGFNLGLDLTTTGVAAGNYGSATSIPTVVVDDKGRVTSITSNSVSTTFGLVGNVGTSSINGGNTLVVVGVPNQISTTVTGNTISIGFTPNITFTDFTVSGNLIYQGGGIKTTTSPTPPTGPVNGDMWYQSGTDILYRYVYDGANEYWLDLFSTPLRAILPSRDIAGGDGEVQFNNDGEFGANVNFVFDKTTGTLKVERFRITKTQSPATPTSPGVQGEITWDGNWMYVCVAPNSWVRAGLYTW